MQTRDYHEVKLDSSVRKTRPTIKDWKHLQQNIPYLCEMLKRLATLFAIAIRFHLHL